MAVQEQVLPGGVAIRRRESGLWADAMRRLLRNRAAVIGGIVIILFFLMAIFADNSVFTLFTGQEAQPLIAPQSYEKQSLIDNNAAPLWMTKVFPSMLPKGVEGGYVQITDKYTLGADDVGRDLLSRIIYGTRVSLSVAIVGPFISLIVGVTFGTIAGYFGGRVDNLMMRFVDVMYAFPTLLLIILLMAFFRSTTSAPEPGTLRFYLTSIDNAMGGMFFIFVGIGITAWMSMARITRGQILSLKEKEFIEAAHALGVRDIRIMLKHILPNIVGPIVVAETLAIPNYIAYEAFLSFIGLGVNRPTPSWGALIADAARGIRTYPNQVIFPALALAIIMFAFNFLGDGLRDALDPRLRGNQ
ncbi:MAG: ABC transporter permease [Anaerolineales bacterium]|nr:MAG: ABC transporter permease [Anaerolineales bacterium]